MNRIEFMGELENLLSDISDSERKEAMKYYNDYFNDAGVENEQEVIGSLGTPQKVAITIKEGLNDNDGEKGEFSETGFSGYTENKQDEIVKRPLSKEERGFQDKNKKLSGGMIALIIIVCIFALPVLGPVGVAVLSTAFAIICAIIGVLIAVFMTGVALIISGIALFVVSIAAMVYSPVAGLLLLGAGLLLLGIGILLAILGIWILVKGIPPMVRGIVNLCRMPFNKKKEVQ